MKPPPKTLKLTRKQKAFADHLIANPKHSATEAATQTYQVTSRDSAEVIASENLRKPAIQHYLAKYDDLAQITVVDVMQNSRKHKDEPAHARVALDSAKDILNRLHGLPVARTEALTTTVNLNLDLTTIAQPKE